MSGSGLDAKMVQDRLRLVQSYVMCPGYIHQAFFTIPTVERFRSAVDDAGAFFISADFDLWTEIYRHDLDSFVDEQKGAYRKLLLH